MRYRLFVLTTSVVVASSIAGGLLACGDKFLNPSRGMRYERSPAARQASAVLIYATPNSELSRTLAKLSVEATLMKAGYRPMTISTVADLEKRLTEKKWDLIILEGTDQPIPANHAAASSAGPHLVPVLFKPTKIELSQARKTYGIVVDTPGKSRAFLDTIDDAMYVIESEAKATKKTPR